MNEPFVHGLTRGKRARWSSGETPNTLSADEILPLCDRECQYYFWAVTDEAESIACLGHSSIRCPARIAPSGYKNAISFSSARTLKCFPSRHALATALSDYSGPFATRLCLSDAARSLSLNPMLAPQFAFPVVQGASVAFRALTLTSQRSFVSP